MKLPLITSCFSRVKGTMMCFGISLRKQFEENTKLCCLLMCVCSVISLTSYWPSYHEIDSGFKFGCVMPSAIFIRFGTQSVPHLASRRSLQIWWGLGATATKRLHLLRNLHLSVVVFHCPQHLDCLHRKISCWSIQHQWPCSWRHGLVEVVHSNISLQNIVLEARKHGH